MASRSSLILRFVARRILRARLEKIFERTFRGADTGAGFVGGCRHNGAMQDDPVVIATRAVGAAVTQLRDAVVTAGPDARMGALQACEQITRQLEQLSIALIAGLDREGVFADRGYRRPALAVADLLGCEVSLAGRWVKLAAQITERTALDGQVLPPRLPATAAAFAAGQIGLRHVETIADALGSAAAAPGPAVTALRRALVVP